MSQESNSSSSGRSIRHRVGLAWNNTKDKIRSRPRSRVPTPEPALATSSYTVTGGPGVTVVGQGEAPVSR